MSQYARLARVYDQDAHRQVAEEFHRTLRAHLTRRRLGDRQRLVIDLGCGSGLLTEHLARHADSVVGVDLSREMLALARDRCRRFGARVRFVRADLLRPFSERGADLATATGDIANHFLELADWTRVLGRVRAALRPGGIVAFDALTEACFELDWNDKVYRLESPAGDLVMECSWDARRRRGTARMTAYARLTARKYERSTTVLEEKFHTDDEIRAALVGAGFTSIERVLWSPWPEQLSDHRMDRALWIARNGEASIDHVARTLRVASSRRGR